MGMTKSSSVLLSIILTLFILAICCQSKNNNNVTFDCVSSEEKALMRFKASFSDDPYNKLTSWKANTDCCSWAGVECDYATGHVVGIDLRNRVVAEYGYYPSLGGMLRSDTIDSSLLELKYLSYLDLSGNDFQRNSIPTFLGSMKQLQYLDLSNANFSGIVPHQIGNLSSLLTLTLKQHESFEDGLRVDDVTWAGNLLSLQYFDMSGVNLSGTHDLIKVLGMLPSLVDLRLSNTLLGDTSHPHTNCVNRSTMLFPNVQYLDMSSNLFGENSSFCFLQNMTSLSFLDLSSNYPLSQTKDIIKVLTTLLSLVDLRLSNTGLGDTSHANPINSTPSSSFGESSSFCFLQNMTSLSFLDLSFNTLHQKADWISDSLWDKCQLKSLNLAGNRFYGDISRAFKNLSKCWGRNMESLDLSENELDGHLPEELGELKKLIELDVSTNNLSGPIPSSLGNLRALRSMKFSSNQLSGEIPISIGQLSNLEWIDMNNNSFEGTLSEAHFANFSRLGYLDIGYNYKLKFRVGDDWAPPFQLGTLSLISNKIGGQFPRWIKTQKELLELELRNCNIRGTLPWLGSLTNLIELDLSNNYIEGPIPELPSGRLEILDLSRNLINGSIPESLCQMKYLEILDISKNYLSGHLSDCNWGTLRFAVLSSNQLSGPIPNSIGGGDRCSLELLQLNNNSFIGKLPSSLKNCKKLNVLDIGDNKLSGELPEWIGNHLLNLGVFRVRNNKFHGNIPSSYCQLSGLQIMDFANNQLTGSIQHCVGNLSGMINVGFISDIAFLSSDMSLNEVMKGALLEYTSTLIYLVNLDLSCNRLFGEIPSELMNLIGLNGLNLSHNLLGGRIQENIGDLKSLESLDLSWNNLSGKIPESISKLNSLSHLNLSNNDLSGPIPTGHQLQTLNDHTSYDDNPRLCGDPLPKKCSGIINNEIPQQTRKAKNDDRDTLITDNIYLYAFITGGLATGFWGYFGVLIFKRTWRLALFRRMDLLICKMLRKY